MDACLVASGQRAEHYEMAAYGTLVAWAKELGHEDVATLLEETLNEEKAADAKLTKLAEGGINRQAAERSAEDEDDHAPKRAVAAKSKATATRRR
jgi:ferritin-like metal-binding protein YciE